MKNIINKPLTEAKVSHEGFISTINETRNNCRIK